MSVEGKGRVLELASVLVVDDDPSVGRMLSERLGDAHYSVRAVHSTSEALAVVSREVVDIILLDVSQPHPFGLDALKQLRAEAASSGIVMISGEESTSDIVEALRLGAVDYLVKPVDPAKIVASVTLAARASRLERENRRLARLLQEASRGSDLVGCSPPLRRLAGVIRRVADSETTVLLEGKPGTGKTLCAEMIHKNGRRGQAPLVTVPSSTATAENLESAMAEASHGTLLFEDVEQMPASGQQRLVRYLKERPERRAPDDNNPDARVLATTTARLPELIARGRFREDLYYRLNVFPIVVPSLQERRDDIPLLAAHFVKQASDAAITFTTAAMKVLESHPWPGNVAQLHGAVLRALAVCGTGPIDAVHLGGPVAGMPAETVAPATAAAPSPTHEADDEQVREEDIQPLDTEEKRLLSRALKASRGNVRRAAQLLRIGRATLYRKIQIYKLKLQ